MISHPFSLLRPFSDQLQIAFFTKEDDIRSDKDAAEKIGFTEAAGLWQKHGNRVVRMDGPSNRTEQADGMATEKRELVLCLRAADCQNFVIFDPKKMIAGVLHVGWRGIEAAAIRSFCEFLKREWGTDPADLLIGAGPSLGKECAEFTDPKKELSHVPADLIDGRTTDLQKTADRQWQEMGVKPEHIERMEDCTKCHPEKYWTYRGGDREDVKEGHTNMLCCVIL